MKNTKRISKAMILGAGLGTRLMPITQELPKPLVPVLNVPNILHTLNLLKRAGIREVIINLHHLPNAIEEYLGTGKRWEMEIAYSREPKLLGTGGGVKKAEAFFEGQRFVLANCDFITNIDLQPVLAKHEAHGALATMVLIEDPALRPHYSAVGIDSEERLCSLPKLQTRVPSRTGIFTGIHVLEASTLQWLDAVPCGINDVLYPALMKSSSEKVFGHFVSGAYWLDTGELKPFWNASVRLLEGLAAGDPVLADFLRSIGGYEEKRPGIWMPRGENLPAGSECVGPVVLGRNCELGKGSQIGPFTVLGDETKVGEGVRVSKLVALGAAEISQSTSDGALQFHRSRL